MALGTGNMSSAVAIWMCNGIMISLILVRLGLRKWRGCRYAMSDGWLVMALLFNGVRMAGDFYANEYGTPLNISVLIAGGEIEDPKPELSTHDQDNLILAGKLMVVARVATVAVLWSLKIAVLDTLRPLLGTRQRNREAFWFTCLGLAFAFFASIMSIFFQCQELRLNWTLFPDAEQCAYDLAWLVTYEISNIFTDLMLFCLTTFLVLSVPISKSEQTQMARGKPLRLAPISRRERTQLAAGALIIILIVVETTRLVVGLPPTDALLYRIVWGSIEVAIATLHATLPTILTLLLPLGPKEGLGGLGKATHEQGSVVAAGAAGEAKPEPLSLQRIELWDNPIWDGMDLDAEDMTRKLVSRNSFHGSTLSSVSAAAGTRDSWPRSIQSLRNVIRSPRSRSRLGRGMRATDDDRPETLHKWIELEETDTGSVIRDVSSPEPDDGGCRSGIFVATEINQEVHRIWDFDQRPRIVTIPRRARLDHSQV